MNSSLFASLGSKLHSLAGLVTRLEKLSYVLAWTKQKDLTKPFNIDLVELPRLKMAFHARTDSDGVTRLYSVDHVNLFVTNTRSELTTRLIRGIPHSVLLSDPNNVSPYHHCRFNSSTQYLQSTGDIGSGPFYPSSTSFHRERSIFNGVGTGPNGQGLARCPRHQVLPVSSACLALVHVHSHTCIGAIPPTPPLPSPRYDD